MKWPVFLSISARYIFARSSRSRLFVAFSFIGIMVAVIALVSVTSVQNGFREDLMGRILGLNGHVSIYGPSFDIQSSSIRTIVNETPGVNRFHLVRDMQGLVRARDGISPFVLRGISTNVLVEDERIYSSIISGDIRDLETSPFGVAIGERLASRFGLDSGDSLAIIVPDGHSTPFGTVPMTIQLDIVSVFRTGIYDVDSMLGFVGESHATNIMGANHRVRYDVFLDNPDMAKDVVLHLRNTLPSGFTMQTWYQEHVGLIGALAVERNIMFLILSLIVFVVGLNIIAGMTTMVRDRRKDIAYLQVLGASRLQIVSIFLFIGFVISLSGLLVGLLIGVPFAANIALLRDVIETFSGASMFPDGAYLFDKLPSRVDLTDTIVISIAILLTGIVAAIPSAWRAMSYDPAEILRNG